MWIRYERYLFIHFRVLLLLRLVSLALQSSAVAAGMRVFSEKPKKLFNLYWVVRRSGLVLGVYIDLYSLLVNSLLLGKTQQTGCLTVIAILLLTTHCCYLLKGQLIGSQIIKFLSTK